MLASSSAAERMGGMFVVTQTVQIIIGLMDFLFGLAMLPNDIGAYTGVFVWGPLFFITAGSVTVAAGKRLNRCLPDEGDVSVFAAETQQQVRTALGFNVVAAVASAVAIIIYSVDANYQFEFWPGNYGNCHNCYYSQSYLVQNGAVLCVLAVFCVLEFVVSICVAAFGCYDVCGSTDQPIIMINPMLQPASENQQDLPIYATASPTEGPPLYEAPTFRGVAPFSVSTIESVTPREYDTVLQSSAAEERHK